MGDFLLECGGDEVNSFAGVRGGGLKSDVLQFGIEGDGLAGGDGPGRGRPNNGVDILAGESRVDLGGIAGELIADVDGGAGVLLVLDLGFGEGGLVVDAPKDGLEALVDEALLEEGVEGFEDAGLVAEGHGEIGVVPAAEDAEALELLALEVDILLGVLAAGAADADGGHFELLAAELLVDLDLDGEAVAVPAGDVGGVEAGHGLGLDHEVLDALVECVAEVDGAVGVGGAVVEDVLGGAGACGADLPVEVVAKPGGEAGRLVLREDWPSWGRLFPAGSGSILTASALRLVRQTCVLSLRPEADPVANSDCIGFGRKFVAACEGEWAPVRDLGGVSCVQSRDTWCTHWL